MSGEGGVHKNHRDRMRARFDAEGLAGFHDHEALELLLYYVYPQGDVNPVAHRLMKRFGSFHRVLEASPEQLMEVPGVGQSAARMLTMVFQIGLRCCQDGVRYRYVGTTDTHRLYINSKAPTEPGTYRQTAYILGGNDMAKSISRSITITAD